MGVFSTVASLRGSQAGVVQARDGRLYGVIEGIIIDPAVRTYGSVFRVEANGALTTLHQFDGSVTANPVGELVEIDDGSLYGTTEGGGVLNQGEARRCRDQERSSGLIPATGALTIRYVFADGIRPTGRLIQGSDGLLYGTTVNGGDFGLGTVFSLDAAGTFTTLHDFAGDDGANPSAGVIQGLDGRLYGTTANGGAFGQGTVFVMNVTGGADDSA